MSNLEKVIDTTRQLAQDVRDGKVKLGVEDLFTYQGEDVQGPNCALGHLFWRCGEEHIRENNLNENELTQAPHPGLGSYGGLLVELAGIEDLVEEFSPDDREGLKKQVTAIYSANDGLLKVAEYDLGDYDTNEQRMEAVAKELDKLADLLGKL